MRPGVAAAVRARRAGHQRVADADDGAGVVGLEARGEGAIGRRFLRATSLDELPELTPLRDVANVLAEQEDWPLEAA